MGFRIIKLSNWKITSSNSKKSKSVIYFILIYLSCEKNRGAEGKRENWEKNTSIGRTRVYERVNQALKLEKWFKYDLKTFEILHQY